MAKPDYAHALTDRKLDELERRIASLYKEAADDMAEKVNAYFESFEKRDQATKAQIGTIVNGKEYTEQDYTQWRLAQIGRGERMEALRDQLAERYTSANEVTGAYINDATPGIYTLNRNYAAYTIEQVAGDVGFTIWDEQTVKRLIVDEPDLMPYYPPEKAIDRGIDFAYGKQQITKQVTTGILQGESIKKVADRLQTNIPNMERNNAIRAARTAITGAQNAGRMASYEAAKNMGIKLKKEWLATLDNRTRHEHAILDGKVVETDQPFEVDGYEIMYPGDPDGAPEMIYNCRCTMIANIDGVDTSDAKRRAIDPVTGSNVLIDDMTYSEWAGWKEKTEHIETSVDSGIMEVKNKLYQPAANKQDAEDYLRNELRVSKVNTTGISLESLNAINGALTDVIQEYPQLSGVIQQVNVSKAKNSSVAAFGVSFKKGVVSTSLTFNVNDLADLNSVSEMIRQNVSLGFWTPKDGVAGIIQHEMGHALEFVQTFSERGVDPFSTSVNGYVDRYTAITEYGKGTVAERVVSQAINNLGMRPMQWTTLSDYAATSYSEAFAEALSDSSDNTISEEIKRIVKGGSK